MNELGELRPSQLIFTFGVGSLVDLPNMSALVMGLDDWDTRYCKEIEEDRLVAAVQKRLGRANEQALPAADQARRHGYETRQRQRSACRSRRFRAGCAVRCATRLATVESGVFKLVQDHVSAGQDRVCPPGLPEEHRAANRHRRSRCASCSPAAKAT